MQTICINEQKQDVFTETYEFGASAKAGSRTSGVKEIQYLEVKQMIDILGRFRNRARTMIEQYRVWQAGYEVETDEIEKSYMAQEGIFLRQQTADALKLYMKVNKDYHNMRRLYLAKLRQPPHYIYDAA